MEFLDEKIAILEKTRRIQNREKEIRIEESGIKKDNEQNKESKQNEDTQIHKFRKEIQKKIIEVNGRTYPVEETFYFNHRLPWIHLVDFFEETKKEEMGNTLITLKGIQANIMCYFAHLEKELPYQDFQQRCQALQFLYHKNEICSTIYKKRQLENLDYIGIMLPASYGICYNINFFLTKGEQNITGSIVFAEKDLIIYGKLMEAILFEINDQI